MLPLYTAPIIAVIAGTTAVLTDAALRPESQRFGATIVAGNDPNEVAFTYDDGPNDRSTLPLLEVLSKYNARATFFMVGQHVKARPDIARQVAAAGHLIGNHTWTHPWLLFKSEATIREELSSTTKILEDTFGQPVHYFRPPHGARRPVVLSIARELGMTPVQWNAMGYDWNPTTPARIITNLTRGLEKAARNNRGANLLLHDGDGLRMNADRTPTVQATELLLQRFATEGKRTVTIDAWA